MNNLEKFRPYALALLRIVAAYMFILHGTAKFWEFPISMTGGNGAVTDPLMIVGGIIEIIGGILVLLGLFTRPAAFILSGQMAYAYFFMHAVKGGLFFPLTNGGELALLYSVVFFYFVFAGSGAVALDNKFKKN
ncbi:DoxX family protein [Rodentibacter pneumotropicus]|uniref:DoxX family protein n=1 Tax=Rodentibacter pneumotropicus TaxID=758 RepID=UPI00232EFFCF|nr:DoxX family protein [Rodentibacter pneumotropicus]MDC2825052.1 DoxX family protein [Rodentibacter pneumotropicus]